MRVLNFSLDLHILENGSAVQRRMLALAENTGKIFVIVSGNRDALLELSEHLLIQSFGGSKIKKFFKMFFSAFSEFQKRKYDLITVQDIYFLGLSGYGLSLLFRVPFEIQVHGLEKFYGVRKVLARFILKRARKIRVVSERLKDELRKNFDIPVSNIYVLSVYAQMEGLISRKITTNKTNGQVFTFLTVGRLVKIKNISMQIRAIARLLKNNSNCRLIIVGDGPERRRLEIEAKTFGVQEYILFKGWRSDIMDFYNNAGAFLFTSDGEGWGVAVVEAAMHGLPIIMTDVGLAGEFIKNNENGIVIPVGGENELVFAMRSIIGNKNLRERLGSSARASFLALPDKEEQIKKQVEVWRSFK